MARLLSASYGAFYEGDEVSIAAGVAGIARDNAAHMYRYGPQAGYYRLVQGLNGLLGGGVLTIPFVMVTLSVLAGTLIPLLGLSAFRDDLTRSERWLLGATLAASPVLWMSSRYGNTAMPAAALVVSAIVILSDRPRPALELAALALFGLSILVRADSVLASAALGVLLWRNHASFTAAAKRVFALGAVLAVVYALLFWLDPYMRQILGDVQEHLATPDRTRFFELLLWAFSPFPLVYAILGLRELEPARRWLLAIVTAWCVPTMGFYFTATTTARYFVLPAFAVAIATAVGMYAVIRLLPRTPKLAWAIVLITGSLHLFVGLSNFYPAERRGWLTNARVGSHDGDVLAGAFLYNSFMQHPVRGGILHPLVGAHMPVERSYVAALQAVADGRYRGSNIYLIFAGGEGHVVHFFAQHYGAQVVDREPAYAITDAVTYELGGARLTAIGVYRFDPDTARVPVGPGDIVWLQNRAPGDQPDTEQRVVAKLPGALTLNSRERLLDTPMLWSYRVEAAP